MIWYVHHAPDSIVLLAGSMGEIDGEPFFVDAYRELFPDSPTGGDWTYEELRALGPGRIEIPDPGDPTSKPYLSGPQGIDAVEAKLRELDAEQEGGAGLGR